MTTSNLGTAEHQRLEEARTGAVRWKAWGPYLSERQWGTVDYSGGGDAWDYFPHDQARSRAYRWGEDGFAGICDERQRLCLSLAMWNGADPILKERMFGLTNSQGNHGEDVKEYWSYLDGTPTHSYLKCRYKYPQREFPYNGLVSTNGSRGKQEMEYELLDTGIFDDDRYFGASESSSASSQTRCHRWHTCPAPTLRPADDVARRRAPVAADPLRHARRGGVPRPTRDPRDLAPPSRTAVSLRLGWAALRSPISSGQVRHRHRIGTTSSRSASTSMVTTAPATRQAGRAPFHSCSCSTALSTARSDPPPARPSEWLRHGPLSMPRCGFVEVKPKEAL